MSILYYDMKVLMKYCILIFIAILSSLYSTIYSQSSVNNESDAYNRSFKDSSSIQDTNANMVVNATSNINSRLGSTDYAIKQVDCLWNISFQFLGNPFQWAYIWQNNPQIKNPDLIFPGDVLTIPDRDNVNQVTTIDNSGSELSSESSSVSSSFQSKTEELLRNVNLQKNGIGNKINVCDKSVLIKRTIFSEGGEN